MGDNCEFQCEECGEVCTFGYRVEDKMMCPKCRAKYWRRRS